MIESQQYHNGVFQQNLRFTENKIRHVGHILKFYDSNQHMYIQARVRADLKRAGLYDDFKKTFLSQIKAKNEIILDDDHEKYGSFLDDNLHFCDEESERSTLSYEMSSFLKRNRLTRRVRGNQRDKYNQKNNLEKFVKRDTKRTKSNDIGSIIVKEDVKRRMGMDEKNQAKNSKKFYWVLAYPDEFKRSFSCGKIVSKVVEKIGQKIEIFDLVNCEQRKKKMFCKEVSFCSKIIRPPAFSRISVTGMPGL